MNTINSFFDNYFVESNKEWLADAYQVGNYNYPVGMHRLRLLKKIISKYDIKQKKVLDIGCGGGDISFYLASQGALVTGIDMSDSMLATCEKRLKDNYSEFSNSLKFYKENVKQLNERITKEKYDFIIAFGLIGYLDSDDDFFKIVTPILNNNGKIIISCRNELFNMTSISNNTKREIKNNNANKLIDEIDELYKENLEIEKCRKFISELRKALDCIEASNKFEIIPEVENPEGIFDDLQPRQSTPKGISAVAEKFGFNCVHFYGVHPHLLLPRFNKKLPTQIFNMLSDSLCVFEEDNISLIWSSVFIGEFVKK